MLRFMRDSFNKLKWVLLAVVAAFVFGFVFIDMGLGGSGFRGSSDDRSFAARVNGETISYNEYYRALKNLEDMYRQMYGQQFTPEMEESMGLKQQLLSSLVDQRLLTQEARRLHLTASPQEVRRKLLDIPVFTDNGKFVGVEMYTRYVTGPLGYPSASAFEADLARDIALSKMESALRSSVIISPKLVDDEYRRTNEKAKIRYVLLPISQQVASIAVTPKEVEDYYRANQSKYTHGEQRKIRFLLADRLKIRSQIVPMEQELRKRYEETKKDYQEPAAAHVLHILVKSDPNATPAAEAAAKAKAESLVARLRAGADFATLARENSEDPSSSGSGGEMGWVQMGQTVEPFEKAIFSVPLNTISDPIRSKEYGFHIVKVLERRPERVKTFQEVRSQLAVSMTTEMANDVAKSEITRVNALIKQKKPTTVQAFVALANDKVTSNDSGWFGRGEPIPGLGSHPVLSQWAFDAKVGDVSDPLGTQRGIAIAYMSQERNAGISPLEEVREQVENDLKKTKARQAVAASLQQMMAGAQSLDDIAKKAGQEVRETNVIRQGNISGFQGDVSNLIDTAMAAGVGQLKGPIEVGDGAAAIQIVEQHKVTAEELAKNRTSMMDTMRAEQARDLRAVLVRRLRKGAKVEINDEITRPTTPAKV